MSSWGKQETSSDARGKDSETAATPAGKLGEISSREIALAMEIVSAELGSSRTQRRCNREMEMDYDNLWMSNIVIGSERI